MGGRCAAAADAPHTARSVSSHLKVVDARRNPVHACHGLAKSRPLARAEETICRSRVPLREESLRKGIDEWELPGGPVGQVRRGFNRITDSRFGGQFDSEERFVWETENLQPDLVHVRHRNSVQNRLYLADQRYLSNLLALSKSWSTLFSGVVPKVQLLLRLCAAWFNGHGEPISASHQHSSNSLRSAGRRAASSSRRRERRWPPL